MLAIVPPFAFAVTVYVIGDHVATNVWLLAIVTFVLLVYGYTWVGTVEPSHNCTLNLFNKSNVHSVVLSAYLTMNLTFIVVDWVVNVLLVALISVPL